MGVAFSPVAGHREKSPTKRKEKQLLGGSGGVWSNPPRWGVRLTRFAWGPEQLAQPPPPECKCLKAGVKTLNSLHRGVEPKPALPRTLMFKHVAPKQAFVFTHFGICFHTCFHNSKRHTKSKQSCSNRVIWTPQELYQGGKHINPKPRTNHIQSHRPILRLQADTNIKPQRPWILVDSRLDQPEDVWLCLC